jgi:hypothetical protein
LSKTEEYFIQLGEEIAQLYGDQKYKASWNLINVVGKRKIRSTGIISAKDPEDRVKLWYNHFNTLLSPQSLTEEENVNLPPIPEFADVTFNTEPITAEELRYNQNGFRPDRSTLQHVLALRRLFEVAKTKKNFRFSALLSISAKLLTLLNGIIFAYNVPVMLVNAIIAFYGLSAVIWIII